MKKRITFIIILLLTPNLASGKFSPPMACSWEGTWRLTGESPIGTLQFFKNGADCIGRYCDLSCRYLTADGRTFPGEITTITESTITVSIGTSPRQEFTGTLNTTTCTLSVTTLVGGRQNRFTANKSLPLGTSLSWGHFDSLPLSRAIKIEATAGLSSYLCRTFYENGQHLGELWNGKCYIGWGGSEIVTSQYEILFGNGSWKPSREGFSSAFRGSFVERQPMYACRVLLRGRRYAGKVVAGKCNVGLGGRELVVEDFEVLHPAAVTH